MQVPYDNEDEDKALNLGPSLFDALKKKPDTEARRQRLARQLDLPSFAIGVDTEAEAEREARLQTINPSQFTIAAPRTSSFLSVPENADVAHDNVENMFSFETMFRMAKGTGQAIGVAPLSLSQGLFNATTLSSDLSDSINIFRYIDPKGYQKRLADRRAFEKQFNTDAERVQDQIRPKGLSMAEDAYYSGIESGTQTLISALLGPVGGLATMGLSTTGKSYQKGLDEGLSPLMAGIYGGVQGTIEVGTEKVPFLGLINDVKIGTPLFNTIANYIKREVPGELAAEWLQSATDWAMLPSNRDKTLGEFAQDRADAFLPTVISTLVGGGFTASVYKATDYALNAADRRMAKMERAAAVKEWTDKASKLAEVDKLLQRAPETFKQFIDEVAADGAVSDLYVDRDVLLQAIENTGIEAPAEVASQLSTATPGSDIRIPAGEFMTYLATPEVYAKLGDHLKTEPSGMTYAQAQEQGKDALAALTATFEGVLTETLKDDEFRASRDRVQDRLFKEQQVAGRFDDTVSRQYAFVGAQMVSVMAKRAGITPEELLAKKALSTKAGDSRAGKKIFAEGGPRVPPTYDRANDPDGYRDMAEQMVMEEQQYTEEELADPQTKREFDIQSRAKFDQIIENNYTPPSTGESNDTRRAIGNQAEAGAVRDGGGVSGGERLLGEQGQPDTGAEERPLTGAPTRIKVDGQVLTFGPFAPAREAARKYMESTGREYTPVQTYQKVDIPFAERVAEAFDEMADDPTNPEVAAAYQAMIEETVAQWQFIKETGLVVEFIEGDDPYGNPWNAILDVVNNNHLYVFPSDTGFGDGVSAADYDVAQQPMLADAPGEFFGGKQAKYNDIFRAVHDYFGHIKDGLGFRGNGEENAYRSHAQMYSPLARRAMAVETRGQNSYLNYGPNREFNATANAAETMYAPQKVGLLPDWVVEERLDDPEDQVLNQYIRNEPYPDNPFPDDRVSTRLPTNKGSRENPDREFLNVSTEAMEMAPDVFAHNANLLLTYEGFVTDAVKPADIVEAYIQFATDNLLWLHDQIPQEIRDRSKLWYDGARALTLKWSEQYDQPPRVIAAVIAALSPQKDWYQNVSMAERILGITLYKADTKMSNEQFDMAYELYIGAQERENIKLIAKGKEPKVIKDDVRAVVESLRNMTLNELNTPTQRAMWVRSYDQTYNPRGYRVTTPEGDFVGKATGKTAWGSNVEISKAIEAIRNPSRNNISKLMGTKHKVRSFYNNIIAPIAGEDVTIDTHAVAAAHLRPHSGSSAEVHHNFGSSPEKKKQGPNWRPAKNANEYGIQGVYAFNADAYRRAAAARGLLPREMQSITWEAIRGLFEKSAKTAKGEASLTNLVNLEWIKYQDGTQTLEETRNAILTLAGGIESPTWLGYDYSAAQTVGLSSYDGELASPELSRGRAGQLGIGSGDTGRIASGMGGNDLLEQSADQTDTPEFKNWFGDSKVVDENNEPLVVYHGTGEDFSEFNTSGGKGKTFGTGAFFSSNPATAATYATGTSKNVMPVYLALRTPAVIDAKGRNWNALDGSASVELPAIKVSDQEDADLLAELTGEPAQQGATRQTKARTTSLKDLFPGEMDYEDDTASTDDLARWARKAGYDGLIIRNVTDRGPSGMFATEEARTPSTLYIAFEPTQIKSATGNRGTFDGNDPNILNQYDPGLAGFRSTLYDTVRDKGPNKAVASEWKGLLGKAPGVKKEEIEWLGLFEFLDIKGGGLEEGQNLPISKGDVLTFIESNGVKLTDKILGEDDEISTWADPRYVDIRDEVENEMREEAFSNVYKEPEIYAAFGYEVDGMVVQGGHPDGRGIAHWYLLDFDDSNEVDDNGVERDAFKAVDGPFDDEKTARNSLRFALSEHRREALYEFEFEDHYGAVDEEADRRFRYKYGDENRPKWGDYKVPGGDNYREMLIKLEGDENFVGSHWSEIPNVMAHARLTDRTDAEGRNVLYVEEIQSDWHEQAQGTKDKPGKGYKEKVDQAKSDALQEAWGEALETKNTVLDAARKSSNAFFKAAKDGGIQETLLRRLHDLRSELYDLRQRRFQGQIEPNYYDEELRLSEAISKADKAARPFKDYINFYDRGTYYWPNDVDWVSAISEIVLIPGFENAFPSGPLASLWSTARVAKAEAEEATLKERLANGAFRSYINQYDKLPDAPFKKSWPELVVKRLIAYAVENGYDRVALPDGDVIGPIVGQPKTAWFYNRNLVNITNDLIKKSGQRLVVEYLYSDQKWQYSAVYQGKPVEAKFFDINDALKAEVQGAGLPLFQNKEEARGTFNPATGVITLNKNANLSTWLHELGHYQLELLAELSSGPDANPQIKADMEAVLSWFSTDLPEPITLEMWQGMTLDEKRVYHEQFARGFEAYLFEGKAPSKELRSVFQKFREWMIGVYKELKALRVELNDEVRGVFDRMLATDEAIAAAQKGRGMQAAFTNRPEGMTEDEWAAYQRIQQEATDEAIDGLQTRSLRDMKWVAAMRSRVIRDLQRSARELYKSVKAEVASEVMQEPVYMAREYLKYGRLYGDEPSPDSRKMDLDMLKAMFPENSGIDLTPLTRGGKYGLTQQDGVHPDVIADMFGFESGDAMVRQLLSTEPMNDKITAITDKRMLERYGDIKDQAALEAAADEIIHNDARARAVHTELSYAEKVLGKKTPLIQAARAFAQNLVDRTILRNLRPDLAESAAERARRAAQTALKNDDMEQFAAQKRNELVHIQTVRAQQKAKEELSSTLSFFARIVTAKDEGLAKRRDLNLVMAARAILAAHGIGRKSQNPQEYLDRALAYDPEVGNQLKLDVAAATIGATGDFKDLTVEQMRALRDVVKQLWDLAKSTKEIEIGADTVAMDDAVAQLIKELEDGPDPKYVGMGMGQAVDDTALMLPGGGLGLPILGVNALLRRVEGWATLKGEAWSRFTFRLVSNAANQYRLALQGAVTRYREILEPISADLKLQKIDGREINYTFGSDGTGIGMAELLGALRHTGNPSNLKKLLIGRGWADINPDGSMDTTRWDAFLARMHKEGILQKRHWDFIQAEWDLHDSLKPQAQKAHKTMYGRYFAEVTAAEVTTPFGVYKGGYVPASTDPNLVDDAALRKEAEDMFGGGSALFPAPANGMTKSRVENYNEPLALNIGMVPSQIARALRFAYLGPAIRDVNRLLRRKDLRSVLKGYDPVAITDVLMPWLERSASQQVVTPAKGRYGKIVDGGLKYIRRNTSLALLFFNLSNTLQNITGLAPAALRTGKRNLLKASMTYLRDPTGTSERIANLSVMMAQRNSTQFDELQAEMRNIILKPNLFQKAQDWSAANAQWLQRGLQNVLDMMVWQAAYNRAIEEQNTDPVGFADSAVRETMGSFGAEDVSAFETGTATSRAFTLFYSYFNTQANLLGNEFAKAPTAARAFEVFTLGVLIPALGSQIIAQALKGNLFDDGDDDEEDGLMTAIEMFFTAPFAYMVAFVPVLGQGAIAIANTFDDKPFNDRLSLSPVISVVESSIKLPKAIFDWASGEDISGGKMIRDTAMLVTLATGIPVSALARPVSYAVSVAEGDVEPTDPFDYARGLVTGVASNPSKE